MKLDVIDFDISDEKKIEYQIKPYTFNQIFDTNINMSGFPLIALPTKTIEFTDPKILFKLKCLEIGTPTITYNSDLKTYSHKKTEIEHPLDLLRFCLLLVDDSKLISYSSNNYVDAMLGIYNYCKSLGYKTPIIETANRNKSYIHLDINYETIYDYGFGNSLVIRYEAKEQKPLKITQKSKPIKSKQKTYLMKDNLTGLYKIGKSIDPKYRESTLQSEKPSVKLIWSNTNDVEKELHERYKNQRVRGEWFDLTNIQVKFIATNY